MKHSILLAMILALAGPASPASAQAGAQNGEWRSVWGDAGATRFQPLDGLTVENVDQLEIAWRWRAGNFGPRPETYYPGNSPDGGWGSLRHGRNSPGRCGHRRGYRRDALDLADG